MSNLIAGDGFVIVFLLMCLLALAALVFVILTLIHQAKRKRWAWFIVTLVLTIFAGLGVFTSIIYWIVNAFTSKRKRKKKKKR